MKNEREEVFGKLAEGTFLYCIHCERTYLKDEYKTVLDSHNEFLQMCPYEGCTGDAFLDCWEWENIRSNHPNYPVKPEKGTRYPMYPDGNSDKP